MHIVSAQVALDLLATLNENQALLVAENPTPLTQDVAARNQAIIKALDVYLSAIAISEAQHG